MARAYRQVLRWEFAIALCRLLRVCRAVATRNFDGNAWLSFGRPDVAWQNDSTGGRWLRPRPWYGRVGLSGVLARHFERNGNPGRYGQHSPSVSGRDGSSGSQDRRRLGG